MPRFTPWRADSAACKCGVLRLLTVTGLAACCIATPTPAAAQANSDQFWPEVDTYVRLRSTVEALFEVQRSTDGATYHSIELGPTVFFCRKPFLKNPLITPDQTKTRHLVLGLGYRYLAGVDQAPENRIEADFRGQLAFPWQIFLADRNRLDFRWIEGKPFSWRYRNRATLQRTFHTGSLRFSPYAQGEVYYDITQGDWSRATYAFGADFPFLKRLSLEPYYQHDHNVGSNPANVNAVGLTLSLYFRNGN